MREMRPKWAAGRERAGESERRSELLRGSEQLANHSPFHGASLALALAYLGLYIDVFRERFLKICPNTHPTESFI